MGGRDIKVVRRTIFFFFLAAATQYGASSSLPELFAVKKNSWCWKRKIVIS